MKFLLVLGALAAVFAFSSATPTGQDSSAQIDGEISPQLYFVGVADGKSFFVDATNRTWTEASTFCASMNMKLASISSQSQFNALQSSTYLDANFSAYVYFWTSGRDAANSRQFVWNGTESELLVGYFQIIKHIDSPDYLTCVTYHFNQRNNSDLTWHECSSEHYVLCETL